MKNKKLWISSFFLLLLVLIAVVGPFLPFIDPSLKEHVLIIGHHQKIFIPPFPPNEEHLLGTDEKGVDLLSKLVVGTRETLYVVGCVILIRYLLAIPLAIAGFCSVVIESILKGWNKVFSFMPPIIFLAFFAGLPFIYYSPNHTIWIIMVLSLLEVGRVSEVIYHHMKETQKMPCIEAGIAIGCTEGRMFVKYYLPEIIPHIIVQIIHDFGRVLFIFAQLGIIHIFIKHKFVIPEGMAPKVENASNAWPGLFSNITQDIRIYRWIPFSVLGALGITILSLNMFADGLQKYFEKKYRTFRSNI